MYSASFTADPSTYALSMRRIARRGARETRVRHWDYCKAALTLLPCVKKLRRDANENISTINIKSWARNSAKSIPPESGKNRMEIRRDPITQSWVVVGHREAAETDTCPFERPAIDKQQTILTSPAEGPWQVRVLAHPDPLYRIEGELWPAA